MSIHLQPPVPLVTLIKTEPPNVIKNEPPEMPEEALEEEISTDIEDIDIVYHPLSEDLIKSETVLEDILENKYLESVQTQALVKTENCPFIKTENITQRNKSEDTSDGNVSRGTRQGVVEVQVSNEHSNALSNLETDEQSILNFSKDLSERFISVRSRKSKNPKIDDTTLWKKEKEKIKVIKALVIPVEAHEYTYLAKDKHVCNHCQHAFNTLGNLKKHIEKIHREVTTMYQCPYCQYKSKWSVREHIISKHKDIKNIQWFQCNLCKKKFKLKNKLTEHMKVHLKHKQIQDGLDLRRHYCKKCNYRTDKNSHLKRHNLVHLKPEEIEYFYCYHCSYKCQRKDRLKTHIFKHDFKNVKQPEEIQYFYCHHCFHKAKQKANLKRHIFTHFKKEQVEFDCYICNFITPKRESIIKHIKKHSKVPNKSEINEGS